MSISQMTATLQVKIAKVIEDAITKNGRIQLTERNQKAHLVFSSQDQIRTDTNPGNKKHESVMSRGALLKLKADLGKYVLAEASSNITNDIVNNLDFEGFVEYVRNTYFKGKKLKTSKSRTDPGFKYTAPIVAERSQTRMIVGSAIQLDDEIPRDADRDILIFKNIPHGTLVTYFAEYIANSATLSLSGDAKALRMADIVKELKSVLNAGHLTGVFNARMMRALDIHTNKKTGAVSVAGSTDTDIVSIVTAILRLTSSADLLSSNIYDDPKLFLRTEKRLEESSANLRLTTEVQFGRSTAGELANQEVGALLSQAGKQLNSLINSVKYNQIASSKGAQTAAGLATKKLFDSLKKIDNYINDRVAFLRKNTNTNPSVDARIQQTIALAVGSSNVYNALISSAGSDPIDIHIGKAIAKKLNKNIKLTTGTSVAGTAKILKRTNTGKKVGSGNLNVIKASVGNIALKIRKLVTNSVSDRITDSLVNLESILRSRINEQVRQNMGGGSESRILNYRTGRFAESVSIERISESRQGMISVFYNYMKNPYATFSEGGRQQYPKTRDPKLLISKSIREIAGPMVANRLRSVVV